MGRLVCWLTTAAPLVAPLLLAPLFAVVGRRGQARRPTRARLDLVGPVTLLSLAAAWGVRVGFDFAWPWEPGGQLPVSVGPWLVPPRPYAALLLGGAAVWLLTSVADWLNWRQVAALPALLIGAGLVLWGGVVISEVKYPFSPEFVSLDWAGPAVTIVWLVLCATVFGWNAALLEIPLGVAGLASLTFLGIFNLVHLPPPLMPAELAMAGSMAPVFLLQLPWARRLSCNSARAGAMTVGFLLGGLAIVLALDAAAFLVALLPLLLIGVPLFSVTYTYVADLRHGGRAVSVQRRRQNLDMLLLSQGYSRGQVVTLLLAGSAYLCALALLLVAMIEVLFLIKTVVLVAGLAGGGVLFHVVARLLPRPRGAGFPARAGEGRGESPPHGEPPAAEEVWLLGVRLHAVTYQGALESVGGFMQEGHPHMVVTSDASAVVRAHDDPEFREIMNEADLVTADGAGVVLASKLLDLPLWDKVSGCDLVGDLCAVAAAQGRSVYFLGAAPGVAEEAARKLQERIGALQVAGVHDGYFDEEEEQRIIADIREQRPGLLLVAMGIPRQEKWIKAHLADLGVPVCIGIGGSLDVISGRKQRAPAWMQRCGLEWLYRTVKEPQRLPRLAALPRIVWMTFGELLRR